MSCMLSRTRIQRSIEAKTHRSRQSGMKSCARLRRLLINGEVELILEGSIPSWVCLDLTFSYNHEHETLRSRRPSSSWWPCPAVACGADDETRHGHHRNNRARLRLLSLSLAAERSLLVPGT